MNANDEIALKILNRHWEAVQTKYPVLGTVEFRPFRTSGVKGVRCFVAQIHATLHDLHFDLAMDPVEVLSLDPGVLAISIGHRRDRAISKMTEIVKAKQMAGYTGEDVAVEGVAADGRF